jgi:hypothetical protein
MSLLAERRTVEVAPSRWWSRPALGVGLPLLVGIVHAALVAPHYFVGSFDDDAGYILTARALLAGQGLTGHLANGGVVVGSYPPGYSALIAPLLWLWPHTFVPLRLFSLVCYAAVFALTWIYLDRRGVSAGIRTAALMLLALGPPFATYATMVMAEAPYLVILLLMLLAIDRWQSQTRVATLAGLATIACAGSLVWVKQAGLGTVAGAVIWLALGGRTGRRRAGLLSLGVFAAILPVVAARLAAGVAIAGSRYSEELGGYYQGGLLSRLLHVLPHSTWQMLSTAIPATLVPYLSPLPIGDHLPDLFKALSWVVTALVAIGARQWWRHHRDAAIAVVPAYLAECVLWPYVNERRAILVLPLLAAWFALGAVALWEAVGRSVREPGSVRLARRTAVALAAVVVVVPLVVQMPRDYLFSFGQSSSHFGGSPYAEMLSGLGAPSDVVETDYQYSTALYTNHATGWSAFWVTQDSCDPASVSSAIAADHASFLLLGDVNKPGLLDRPCLLELADQGAWAVELLHTSDDDAYVFELVGPGTGHPELADLTPLASASTALEGDQTVAEWRWSTPRSLTQVSLSGASVGPSTSSVRMELLGETGRWTTVASASSGVGDGRGFAPFLMASAGDVGPVRALRVVVGSSAAPDALDVADVRAIGPAARA